MGKVVILMGLYNGARFLQEQLDSFLTQKHENWSLVVSDDGSTDEGPALVRAFAKAHPQHDIRLVDGPRKGFAQNFLSLLDYTDEADYIAFSDQDDVWLPEKLSQSIHQLPNPEIPALICGRTIYVDKKLNHIRTSFLFQAPPGFRNALVQNIGGGNTMVLTRGALTYLQNAKKFAAHIVCHDWWAYQVISGIGAQVIYDPVPQILYRQHEDNEIGSNTSPLARIKRFSQVRKGQFKKWNTDNISSLIPIASYFTAENQASLEAFKTGRNLPFVQRIKALWSTHLYRQTVSGTIILWIAIIIKKI